MTLKTANELRTDAQNQFNNLITQGKQIKNFQSNLDLLLKRYHTNDSWLDNASNSYGQLSWWLKLGAMTGIISTVACLGIVFNAVLILALVTATLCASLALILENHFAALVKKDHMIAEDIAELENSLTESIQHMHTIEENLQAVFTSLCELNLQQAEDIAEFEAQIQVLETQASQLSAINSDLDCTKNSLANSTEQINTLFSQAKTSLTTLADSLLTHSNTLDSTERELQQGTLELLNDHTQLQRINSSFDESHRTLSTITTDLNKLLRNLKTETAATADTEQLLSQADQTIHSAVNLLDEYKREHTSPQHPPNNVQAALERATTLLASHYTPAMH